MTAYCLFKFKDESLFRITPTGLVRVDQKRFSPVSARDLPEGTVTLKWQKSVCDGSFNDDGYFPAEIFAIAGSVKTAEAKAAEMKLRLHPSPLLALPESKSPKSPKVKRRSTKQGLKQKSSEGEGPELSVKPELKETPSLKRSVEKCKGKGSQDKSNEQGKFSDKESKKKKNEVDSLDLEHPAKKAQQANKDRKKKRIKLEPVALERTAELAKLAECTNPLFEKHTLDCNAAKTSDCLKVKKDTKDVIDSGSDNDDLDSTLEVSFHRTCPADSTPRSRSPSPACSTPRSRSASPARSAARSRSASPAGSAAHSRSASPAECLGESSRPRAGSPAGSGPHVDLNSDINFQDFGEGDSSDATSDSSCSNSSDSEDDVSKLASAKEALKQTVKSLKTKLAETKRNYALANNLRIAHLKKVNALEDSLKEKSDEVQSLIKKNSLLQDLLLKTYSGSSEKDTKPNEKKNGEKKEAELNGKIKKEKLKRDSSDTVKKEVLKGASAKDSPNKTKRTDSTSFNTSALSPGKKEKNVTKNNDPKESATSHDAIPSSSGKKDKKRKRVSELDDPEINLVCRNILKQLRKEDELVPDEAGFVNVGLDVRMDKNALFKQLADQSDLSKISKGVTALTWTTSQREERSLEGGKNNRFPDAPAKKAATPHKVNAVLGVLKAHMIHLGDVETGPGMAQNLKTCRKAIGTKFATDAQAKKRM